MMSTGVFQWLFIVLGLSIWITYTNSEEIRVVCYYTNWSVYRPGNAKFGPQNINPYLCTHLVYAFGGFTKENNLKPFDKYQDIEKGGYAKFTGLKTYNKNLKTLLAIGGWNEASSRFSPMVANADRRKQLVKNSIKFLRQNHFDGLDLDWEYPAFREGGKPRDKENYAKLVQELREEFDRESEKTGRPRLLLTMAVPAGIEYINKGYDIPKLTKYLDWMNILSYDFHSAFEPAVNHHAPLFPLQEATEYDYDTELNIDYTVKHYLELGADPTKLVVGIPTYGRSYTLFNPDANAIGDPADGPGEMGEATRENGYLAYYEICENIKSNGWDVVQPKEDVMGPYAFKENQWVGYDDESIVRKKAEYVAKNKLGGIMFWAIDNDDFRGNCHGKPYPLIESGKEALINALGLSEENLLTSTSKPEKIKNRTRVRPKATENTVEESITKSTRRRNRLKSKSNPKKVIDNANIETESRKIEITSTYSSLRVITPAYTTPEPPATPDQGGAFKCEDEGFFPHPKDCKKYFWCLSGPGELGIVAHQFTCPAGLFFNKAADSCDYSQNVLCSKKLSKSISTTTTTTDKASVKTTTKPSTTSTTARTTTSTTEENYESEYEYEDDVESEIKVDSEEDPKVIKELLDLIKKAGGIEELEKQLKRSDSYKKKGVTTPSTRTKSIVEKFLNNRNIKNVSEKERYTTINRNSRGPQNEGIKDPVEEPEKKPQYTSIARRRFSTPKSDEVEVEEKTTSKYTIIRRNKEESTEKITLARNKFLDEGETEKSNEITTKSDVAHSTPHYVNIRRQRPSTTTEESMTVKDTPVTTLKSEEAEEITRGPTITKAAETRIESSTKTPKYQILTRYSSTPTTESTTIESKTSPTSTEKDATSSVAETTKSPGLFEPRPFSVQTSSTEKPTKVSESKVSSRLQVQAKLSDDDIVENRAKLETRRRRIRPTTSTQKILTEKEEDEVQRKYRPVILDDLSSLTAADIATRDNSKNGGFRRIKLRTTTTSDTLVEESEKTGGKNNFGRGRKNEINDQIKSNTDDVPVTRRNNSARRTLPRTKKIFKRVRASTTSTINNRPTEQSNIVTRRGRPFTYSSLNINSRTSEQSDLGLNDEQSNNSEENIEEDENIKLSASNIRESNTRNVFFNARKGDVSLEKVDYGTKVKVTSKPTVPRTRKLIRKIKPTISITTETSKLEESITNRSPRTRKIIRRLKPTNELPKNEGRILIPSFREKSQTTTEKITEAKTIRSRSRYIDIVRSNLFTNLDSESTTLPTANEDIITNYAMTLNNEINDILITSDNPTTENDRNLETSTIDSTEVSTDVPEFTKILRYDLTTFKNDLTATDAITTVGSRESSTKAKSKYRSNYTLLKRTTTESSTKYDDTTENPKTTIKRIPFLFRSKTPTPAVIVNSVKQRRKFKFKNDENESTTEKLAPTKIPETIEKQRSRNKFLFSKKRKNAQILPFTTEESTTEHLTTLYHVFAEPEIDNEIRKNEKEPDGEIEKIVEISRIVHVNDGNKNTTKTEKGRIGAINRVTSIKVVEGGNLTTDIDQTDQRLAVVHDIIEQEKVLLPETIDHIQVITLKPAPLPESSTISLEGLFTETTTGNSDNELLDTEHSRFVNIKILKPEEESAGFARSLEPPDTPTVVKVLPNENEEDVTIEAKVVEVTPKNRDRTIRIAPIQVAMARAIADTPIVGLSNLNEKIGKTPFRLTNSSAGSI